MAHIPTRMYANGHFFSNSFVEGSPIGVQINVAATGSSTTNTVNGFATLIVSSSDNFQRAGPGLGANWVQANSGAASPLTIINSTEVVTLNSVGADAVENYNLAIANDQWSAVQVLDANGAGGVPEIFIRANNTNAYRLTIAPIASRRIPNVASWTLSYYAYEISHTTIATANAWISQNDYVLLAARGSDISAWRFPNGLNSAGYLICSGSDTNLANGNVGIGVQVNGQTDTDTIITNFSCGVFSNTQPLLTMRMHTTSNTQIINMVETGTGNLRIYANGTVKVNAFSEIG